MKCPERPGGFDNGDNWRSTAGFEPNLETRTPKPEGPETEGGGGGGGGHPGWKNRAQGSEIRGRGGGWPLKNRLIKNYNISLFKGINFKPRRAGRSLTNRSFSTNAVNRHTPATTPTINNKTSMPLSRNKSEQQLTPGFDPQNPPSGRQCGFPENATVQSTRFWPSKFKIVPAELSDIKSPT